VLDWHEANLGEICGPSSHGSDVFRVPDMELEYSSSLINHQLVSDRYVAMRRLFSLLIIVGFVVPSIAQMPASDANVAQAQKSVSNEISSDDVPIDDVPQNAPCAGQPKSIAELKALFQLGRLPLSSKMTGTWVEIGDLNDDPLSGVNLNCSGVMRGNKFEFVLVANGYSAGLHVMGMGRPQRITMERDRKGSITFPLDFGADEGPDTYRCRLTKQETLTCLLDAYSGSGVEFQKMTVEKAQIYDVTELP
jgi:hypothetical protein